MIPELWTWVAATLLALGLLGAKAAVTVARMEKSYSRETLFPDWKRMR